jgi:hypothetical protein
MIAENLTTNMPAASVGELLLKAVLREETKLGRLGRLTLLKNRDTLDGKCEDGPQRDLLPLPLPIETYNVVSYIFRDELQMCEGDQCMRD